MIRAANKPNRSQRSSQITRPEGVGSKWGTEQCVQSDDVGIVKVHGDEATTETSSHGFRESAIPVETCHCERQSEQKKMINLEGLGLPFAVPKANDATESFIFRDSGMAIGVRPIFSAALEPIVQPAKTGPKSAMGFKRFISRDPETKGLTLLEICSVMLRDV